MTDSMVRWVMLMLMIVGVVVAAGFDRVDREKRQVTYHRDEHHEHADDDDDQSIQPVTKKPLPTQVVYPGDLSSFYTTESSRRPIANQTSTDHQSEPASQKQSRLKRSAYLRRRTDADKESSRSPPRSTKPSRSKDMTPQESRLHSSYHNPSVSIMNDVPVEMSFDGAGFLRHEDEDSSEQKDAEYSKPKKSRGRAAKPDHDNNKALDDFRKVFNLTRDRVPDQVKFDDDSAYQQEPTQYKSSPEVSQEKVKDYGTQAAENNGSPFAIDYMNSFQNAYQNQFQNPFQTGMMGNSAFNYMPSQTSAQQGPSYDPFTFNFPNIFNGQQTNVNPSMNQMQSFNQMQNMNPMQNVNQIPNLNPMPNMQVPSQMRDSGLQQESYMQNHRMPSMANPAAVSSMYPNVPQQNFNPNNVYQPNINTQSNIKTQRRKRSVTALKNPETDIVPLASEAKEDHYRHSQSSDQQDASSGFIPITGNFNGGSIQLSFPFYGQSPMSPPSYSTRPVHPVSMYSMPVHSEGRQYGGMERYYHPSEARRYSYGVLGSGNFEVIRGGLFPGERQQSFNGYQDGRIPYGGDYGNQGGGYGNQGGGYGNQGGEYGNFGTTEIIIDGPIQGFQGFDNFPAHLINALSKHSEVSIRPNHRESELQ